MTTPFVLWLLDGWPLGRLAGASGAGAITRRAARLLLEKLPLLALSAAASAITYTVQRNVGAIAVGAQIPASMRLDERARRGADLPRAERLAERSGRLLSAPPGQPGPPASGRRSHPAGAAHGARAGQPAAASVPVRGLALVPRHARPRDRSRAGGHPGARGPLHVPAADRALARARLSGRRAGAQAAPAARAGRGSRCCWRSARSRSPRRSRWAAFATRSRCTPAPWPSASAASSRTSAWRMRCAGRGGSPRPSASSAARSRSSRAG